MSVPEPPLPSDRSPSAIVERRLHRQYQVAEGSMKLPFVPGSIGGEGKKSEQTLTEEIGITFAEKYNALRAYLLGGPEVFSFSKEFDAVVEALRAEERAVDFENLSAEERRAVRIEVNRRVNELTLRRRRLGL